MVLATPHHIRPTELLDFAAKVRKLNGRTPLDPPLFAWGELRWAAFERRLFGDLDQVAWESCADPMRMMIAVEDTAHKGAGELLEVAFATYLTQVQHDLVRADRAGHPEAGIALANMGRGVLKATGMSQLANISYLAGQILRPVETLKLELVHQFLMAMPLAPIGFGTHQLLSDQEPRRSERVINALSEHEPWFTTEKQRTFLRHCIRQRRVEGRLSDIALAYAVKTLRGVGAWIV